MSESAAEKFAREYHSEEHRAWVGSLACCACGKKPSDELPSHNHHVRSWGTGIKAPYTSIVPLCFECHNRYHQIGKLSFLQRVHREGRKLRLTLYRGPYVVGYVVCDDWDHAAEQTQKLWLREGIAS